MRLCYFIQIWIVVTIGQPQQTQIADAIAVLTAKLEWIVLSRWWMNSSAWWVSTCLKNLKDYDQQIWPLQHNKYRERFHVTTLTNKNKKQRENQQHHILSIKRVITEVMSIFKNNQNKASLICKRQKLRKTLRLRGRSRW